MYPPSSQCVSWSALRQAAIYNIYNCVYVCVGGWYRAVWGRVTEREWAEGECRGLKGAIIQQAQWALCAGGHSVTVGRGAGQRAAPCHNVFQHTAQERGRRGGGARLTRLILLHVVQLSSKFWRLLVSLHAG